MPKVLLKNSNRQQPKIALVYDRANTFFGGAERILVALAEHFAPLDLFTPLINPQTKWVKQFHQHKTSFINRLPLAQKYHQLYAPLMPLAVENFDLSAYDIIISLSSAETKAVLTKPGQLHINYLLTPPRYLYQYDQVYLGATPQPIDHLIKLLSAPARAYLRWFDQMSIFRPDVIVPISQLVRRRAQRIYPQAQFRPALYPFAPNLVPEAQKAAQQYAQLDHRLRRWQFNLSVNRLVKYKRVDLTIKASLKVKQPLLIVGRGIEQASLLKLAGPLGTKFVSPTKQTYLQPQQGGALLLRWLNQAQQNGKLVFFLDQVSDQILSLLYQHAQVVIAPGWEDFGLVPLEAAYFGTPSIINARSGVAEVLHHQKEAWHLKRQSVTQLAQILNRKEYKKINQSLIKAVAQKFNQKTYLKNFGALVYDEWRQVSYKV